MKLPDIFKNEVEENLKNSREIFYGKEKECETLEQFPYLAIVQTKSQTFKVKVIGKTTNYLVTANGKMLYLKDCLSIKRI